MAATSYAGGAQAATLNGSINTTATAVQVSATTGWPNTAVGPFVAKIYAEASNTEEKILISAYDGSGNLTFTRAYDGTSASAHDAGATIIPCWDATSAQDANNHIYVTTRNDHTQYLTATSLSGGSNYHDKTARHAFGAALGTPGTPTSIYNTSGSAGSGSGPARSDHVHLGIPLPTNGYLLQGTGAAAGDVEWVANTFATIDTTSSDITTIALAGNTAAAGSVGLAADAGHTHAFAGVVGSYYPTNTNRSAVAGELTLMYGLPATRAVTLPAASTTPAFAMNWVINMSATYTVNVDPSGSDSLVGQGNGGSPGAVTMAPNTSAMFVRTSSSQWTQAN